MNINKYNKKHIDSASTENSTILSANNQDEGIFTFDMESSNVDQNVADVKSCVSDQLGDDDVKSCVDDQFNDDDVKSNVSDQSCDDVKSYDDDGQGDCGFPVIQNFSDIKNNLLSPVLIDGILKKGNKLMITGPSKSGKSFLLRQLGLAVASGTSWLGMKCEKGKVLYIDLEHDRAILKGKLLDTSKAMNAEELVKGNFFYIDLKDMNIDVNDFADSVADLVNEILPDTSLIIIDSIYMLDFDENNDADVANLIKAFNGISEKTGAAIAYCHNHAKGASNAKPVIDRCSGSEVFGKSADAIIDISKYAEKDGKKIIRIETALKEFESPEPCLAVFEYPLFKVIDS